MNLPSLPVGLYVVATPIGNLDDISLRALQILSLVKAVACEDTRHFQHLALRHHITASLFSLHEYNEVQATDKILALLREGHAVALVSDAGTPGLSDPGARCVHIVRDHGYPVVPIPGASALTAALSVAGALEGRTLFYGFLPARAKLRQAHLQELAAMPWTLVFYEAPHRLLETLQDMSKTLGEDRRLVWCRELTKRFEETQDGTMSLAIEHFNAHSPKGEFVLVVPGQVFKQVAHPQQATLKLLLEYLPASQAATLAAKLCDAPRRELYQLALTLKEGKL